jgi:hypothetical protein
VAHGFHIAIWRIFAEELVDDVVTDRCHLRLIGYARGHLLVADRRAHAGALRAGRAPRKATNPMARRWSRTDSREYVSTSLN